MDPWIAALAGGVLIGVAAAALLVFEGRIAGVSGMLAGLITRAEGLRFRIAFLAGLVTGGIAIAFVAPSAIGAPASSSPVLLVAGGVLVGLGARVGGGCTSGHGVCGIGSLSWRSITATIVFMITGALAAYAMRVASGGG